MAGTERPTTDDAIPVDVVGDLSLVAQTLLAPGDVLGTLQTVVELATSTIEGCDFAGIFFREGGVISTRVHTDPLVEELDDLQHQMGEGPCLEAINSRSTFYAGDLSEDQRWPDFGPAAAARGVRSSLGLFLVAGDAHGALNLYSRYPRAFGVIDRGRALILATWAGIAITVAREHETEQRRIDSLYAALATREVIGQAQGILMERERVAADEAFDILRRASQHLNRKLREVAQDLVDTGERPETASPPLKPPAG